MFLLLVGWFLVAAICLDKLTEPFLFRGKSRLLGSYHIDMVKGRWAAASTIRKSTFTDI